MKKIYLQIIALVMTAIMVMSAVTVSAVSDSSYKTEDLSATPENAVILDNSDVYPVTPGDVITYTVDLTAARLFEDIHAIVYYDKELLELSRIKSDDPYMSDSDLEGPAFCPNLTGVQLNARDLGGGKIRRNKALGRI